MPEFSYSRDRSARTRLRKTAEELRNIVRKASGRSQDARSVINEQHRRLLRARPSVATDQAFRKLQASELASDLRERAKAWREADAHLKKNLTPKEFALYMDLRGPLYQGKIDPGSGGWR